MGDEMNAHPEQKSPSEAEPLEETMSYTKKYWSMREIQLLNKETHLI